MLWLTGQRSVPVLILDGAPIADSSRIIAALERFRPEPHLYPADPEQRERALALEDFFDEQLGAHIRRTFFYEVLPHTAYSAAMLTPGFGRLTRLVYRALFPGVRSIMRSGMRIDATGADLGRQKIKAALDRISAELGPSGYLAGDGFSVADLTAAALLSPLVMPPEFPYQPPGPLPEPAAATRRSFESHPAFSWVREIYRRHRGRSAEIGAD
jgi:glutathione S-transferase